MRKRVDTAGLSLLELLVVLALLGVIATFGYPALDKTLNRSKLEGSARQGAVLMQLARFEAIKRSITAGVVQDFEADVRGNNEMIAFVDDTLPVGYSGTDRVLQRFNLPAGVAIAGPGDAEGNVHVHSSIGLPVNAEGEATALFDSAGALANSGGNPAAFRFSDRRGNSLEIRVDPPSIGKVRIQKYTGTGDAAVETNWHEAGEDRDRWVWN